MFHRGLLASSALALCVAGCAPDDERSRIVTELPRDGYALFEVKPGGAKRVAFVVEMRDVDEGTFVLLYTPKEPTSSGWFELDAGAYFPCRHYGPSSTEDVDVGCVVPGGHGALVDAVVAGGSGSSQVILRHELGDDEPDASCSCTKNAPIGWYAVMRIAKSGPAIPIAVEAISMDETEPFDAPTVTDRN
jgi:hypothetical protein